MKNVVFVPISLLALSCTSTICPNDRSVTRSALPGQYFLGVDQATCSDALVSRAPADAEQHHLTLSSDRKSLTETFVRNGKTYVVAYDVVSIDWASL